MVNSAYPDQWFLKVRRFTVSDEIDPNTGRASTIIKIYYNDWWSFCRKLRFIEEAVVVDSVDSYDRHPDAQALVERLKQATKCSASQVLARR
jgi:hypothetical protein